MMRMIMIKITFFFLLLLLVIKYAAVVDLSLIGRTAVLGVN